jgi:hypothetical protein
MQCGENPSRVYKQTRMDSIWEFRKAYNSARNVLRKQDDFCVRAQSGAGTLPGLYGVLKLMVEFSGLVKGGLPRGPGV